MDATLTEPANKLKAQRQALLIDRWAATAQADTNRGVWRKEAVSRIVEEILVSK